MNLEYELQKNIYINSYYSFFKDAFKALNPEEDYSDNWHIKYICDRLQKEAIRIKNKEPREKDIIINVPFRSSKSLICTVAFNAWSWLIYPSMKFICTSYSSDLALEHAQLTRDIIKSQWFQYYFGEQLLIRRDQNNKGMFSNDKTGFRKSVGVGGQITGSGADIIIVDDAQSPRKAESEKERANSISFYDTTLYSRLNQPDIGVRIIIMQRLHQQDLSGYLLEQRPEDHEHICLPADISQPEVSVSPEHLVEKYDSDGLFWPQRFSRSQLETYLRSLGTYGYSGQLQQIPTPPGGGIIKRDWIDIVEPHEIQRDNRNNPIDFFLDTSYTEKHDNDPNAFLACFERNGILYVMNCHEDWMEFPRLCEYTQSYAQSNGYTDYSRIYIEPKANGLSLIQQLRTTSEMNIIQSDPPKDDKVTRLNSVSPIFESRRIKLISGAWNKPFLDQLCNQPNSARWDMTDCIVAAVQTKIQTDSFLFL